MTLVPFVLIFIFLCQVLEVGDSPVNKSVKFGEKSMDRDICPSASKWQMRSESLCPEKPTSYHCLHTKTGNYEYVEICIDPIYVEKGNYPVIFVQERQTLLSIEECPPNHYQQISQWSSEYKRVGCDDEKSVCDADGEETCDDRGPTKNRLCRCKYYKGFAADILIINNDQNKMCYNKKMGGSRCVPFSCPKGQELNAASQCVNVCPSGFYRPLGQLYCVKNDTLTRTSTTSTISTTTTEKNGKSVDMNKNENESSGAESEDWIGAVVVILVLLPLVIFVSISFFCGDKLFRVKMKRREVNKKAHKNGTLEASLHVQCISCFSVEYSWTIRKDETDSDVSIEDDKKYRITDTRRSSSLKITDLQVEDQAEYICTATIRILKCFKAFKKMDSTMLFVTEDEPVLEENPRNATNTSDNSGATVININVQHIDNAVLGNRGVISTQTSIQEEVDKQSTENEPFLQKKKESDKKNKSKKTRSLSDGNDHLFNKKMKSDADKSQGVKTLPEENDHLMTDTDKFDEKDETGCSISLVPLQKQGEDSEEPSKETGEKLRKPFSNNMRYKDGEIIYSNKLQFCIGCIETDSGHGTAFRVGSKYVMTAYHVVADVLERFWKAVYKKIEPTDKNSLDKSSHEPLPDDGEWSLANIKPALELKLQGELREIGEGMVTELCIIKFNYVGDESPVSRKISHNVPFVSRTHDVVILELKDENAASMNCISLEKTTIPSEQLHVIGHPGGRDLQHDPWCRIISDEDKLAELKRKGIEFFQQFKLGIDVRSGYNSCKIDNQLLLFHCSRATAHGASGSPLIVIRKDKPKATGMLIHGYPKFFYNHLKDNPNAQEHPEYLIESGISMEKVAALLEEHNMTLLNDIFSA